MSVYPAFDRSSEGCDEYLNTLSSLLRRLAPMLVARWGQLGRDLIDEAPGRVWELIERGKFDPCRAESFKNWCCTVLRNLLYQMGRREKRRRGHEITASTLEQNADTVYGILDELEATENTDSGIHEIEAEDFLTASFSEADAARIRDWDMLDRIILLCLAGLWRKVPVVQWASWCDAVARERKLTAPLPPDELLECETREQRLPVLASALDMRRNTLAQRWKRRKQLLHELDCVEDLQGAD